MFATSRLLADFVCFSCSDDDAPISSIARTFLPRQPTHTCRKTLETVKNGTRIKYNACKVCSLLSTRHETSFYCVDCSDERGKIWLCNVARRPGLGNTQTCWNLWHTQWYNGTKIPKEATGAIRRRRTESSTSTGAIRRRSIEDASVESDSVYSIDFSN